MHLGANLEAEEENRVRFREEGSTGREASLEGCAIACVPLHVWGTARPRAEVPGPSSGDSAQTQGPRAATDEPRQATNERRSAPMHDRAAGLLEGGVPLTRAEQS